MRRKFGIVAILFILFHSGNLFAYTLSFENLEFETQNHSMWGAGSPSVPPKESTSSTSWKSSSTVGGITGDENEVIIPGFTETIPAVYSPVYVPPYWSCDSWGTSFLGTSYCKKGSWKGDYTYQQKISDEYTIVHDPVTADTRSGAEVTFSTEGKISMTSSLGVTEGDISADLSYDSSLEIPDNIEANQFFSLSGHATLEDGSFDTNFGRLTGKMSTRLDVDLDASSTGCFIGTGCSSSSSTLIDIHTNEMELIEVNHGKVVDGVSFFGFDDYPIDALRFALNVDAIDNGGAVLPSTSIPGTGVNGIGINLGTVAFDAPELRTTGAMDSSGKLTSSGDYNNIISIDADLDALAFIAGFPAMTGVVINAGPLTFRGDLLDLGVGPTVDLRQEFSLDPQLSLRLDFSREVLMREFDNGQERVFQDDYWEGLLDDLPEFALLDDQPVDVTPMFHLEGLFSNTTWFDLDYSLLGKMLSGSISLLGIPVASDTVFNFPDLFIPLTSFSIFDDSWMLDLGMIGGQSFTLQSTVANGPYTPGGDPVPEPATLLLFALGSTALAATRRRQRRQP